MKNEDLLKISRQVRIAALSAIFNASSGHPGGSLSSADILTFLYFGGVMRFRPENPKWPERDYFILSNGHVCPSYYAVLAEAGFFKTEGLANSLRSFGLGFEGHPLKGSLPGVETTT
ncbi:MAG: transketolase, partial [bacterium]|nr:transketolase [bacterium]